MIEDYEADILIEHLKQTIKKLIEAKGDTVGLNTPDCLAFRETHKNCYGFQYFMGCTKQLKIMQTALVPPGKDDLLGKILAAKTPEELETIEIPIADFDFNF